MSKVYYRGKVYNSRKEFAKSHNIDYAKFNAGLNLNLTVAQSIKYAKGTYGKPSIHKGRTAKDTIAYGEKSYTSYSKLASDLNIEYRFFMRRLGEGLTLEEAVELARSYKPIRKGNRTPCFDHLGNEYYSIAAMARAYKKSPHELAGRLSNGWSVEEALTTPSLQTEKGVKTRHGLKLEKEREEILAIRVDHKGNTYGSNERMLQEYNISSTLFLFRMMHGWTLRESLVIKPNGNRAKFQEEQRQLRELGFEIEDEGFEQIAEKNGVSIEAFYTRIKRGASLKDALTKPSIKHKEARDPVDHLGNVYENINEMCAAYKTSRSVFNNRVRVGWSLKDALQTPSLRSKGERKVQATLEEKGVDYIQNRSIKYIFNQLHLQDEYENFIDNYLEVFHDIGTIVPKARIKQMRFNFTLIKDNKVFAFLEYDDQQQFGIIGYFFRTLMEYLTKYRKDTIKTMFSEVSEIPLLRIRYDQIEHAEYMIEDLIEHPKKYLQRHNTFISDEKYWKEAMETAILAEKLINE